MNAVVLCRDDDDDKSDNSDENDTFALTSRQKELERRKMQESILAAAEGRLVCASSDRILMLPVLCFQPDSRLEIKRLAGGSCIPVVPGIRFGHNVEMI